ncbi:MAG: HD domain-containing protein [Clostridiales bacterium]|nr:HD domain-containing protein [Clostridiales bacterium]
MNLKRIGANDLVEGFAIVKSCEKKTTQRGAVYLDIMLSDKESTLNAKLWDFKEDTELYEPNTLVKVRGQMTQFNGNDQLRIERIRKAVEADGVDISDYVPSAEYTGEFMLSQIRKTVSSFKDDDLKKLCNYLLDENEEKLLYFPAAFKLHHAFRSGLLMHTLSLVRIAERICEVYPFVNRDLLLCGAILHDISKLEEFNVSETGIASGYTVEGELIGHLVMGAMKIENAAKSLDIPKEKTVLIEHMLISHHGVPEYGSAVRPRTLEAELLSQIDLMDATVFEIVSAISPLAPGDFSTRQWALDDRRFYRHEFENLEEKTKLD